MKKNLLLAFIFAILTSTAWADVPIVDYSGDATQATVTPDDEITPAAIDNGENKIKAPKINLSSLSTSERLSRVEQQVDNLYQQDLIKKIADLQESLQKVTGQLDEQAHQLAQLSNQSQSFYQDLNQRLGKCKDGVDKKAPVTNLGNTSSTLMPASTATIVAPAAKPPVTVPAKKPPQQVIDAAFLKEQQFYQTTVDLLGDQKNYAAGAKKLNEYIKKYPKGAFVANAHYWLGEVYFFQKNYLQAETELRMMIAKYADSKKVPDALLTIALIHENQGLHEQARNEFKQIIKKYPPNIPAVQLAKQQLESN